MGGMETPCIDVCVIDEKTGLCAGCYRTMEEIARWASMTPAQRREVMAQLPSRKTRPEQEA
ncbi:MAG: DUF1289 domain-containing protein [Hyphomicrobiales bacterium]